MPPAFRAATTLQNPSTATVTTNVPTWVPGDVLIWAILTQGDRTIGTPAGWLPGPNVVNGTLLRLAVFTRTAAAEPASYAAGITGGVAPATAGMISVSGADPLLTLDAFQTAASSTIPGTVPLTPDCLGIYIAGYRAAATRTWTPPGGYTEQVDTSTSTGTVRIGMTIATGNQAVNSGTPQLATAAALSGANTGLIGTSLVVRPPRFPASLDATVGSRVVTGFASIPARAYLTDDTMRQEWWAAYRPAMDAERIGTDPYYARFRKLHRDIIAPTLQPAELTSFDSYMGTS